MIGTTGARRSHVLVAMLLAFACAGGWLLPAKAWAVGWAATDFLVANFTSSNNIAVYDQNFVFKGYLDTAFPLVAGLDFDSTGRLVGASQQSKVKIYDSSGSVASTFSHGDVGFPIDAKIGPSDLLYIGTQSIGVREFTLGGSSIRSLGLLTNPDSVAILPGGVLWAGADGPGSSSSLTRVYSIASGLQTGTIALDNGQGLMASMYYSPSTGTVLTTDSTVRVFERDSSGGFVRVFTSPFSGPSFGVTRGPGGDVYATVSGAGKVAHWLANGTYVGAISVPQVQNPMGIVWAGNTPCGNGIVGSSEQCDLGALNGAPGTCCTSSCQYVAPGTICRTGSGDPCDPSEVCTGSSDTCPADIVASTAAICRSGSGDACDPDEHCPGVAGQPCPPDVVSNASVVCRSAAGVCDLTENCPGTAGQPCPADGKSPGICRPAAGVCDLAESCDGVGNDCPADSFAGAFMVCRTAAGACDVEEHCDGSSSNCPSDAKSTAVCRSAVGVCDLAESCDGVDNDCPADSVAGAFAICRPAAGVCDVADHCDGSSVACPADAKSTAVCRAAAGICDVAESCNGVSNTCPSDGFEPTSTTCRAAVGVCDVAEHCTGASAACPANGFASDGATCNDGNSETFNDQCTTGVCQGASAQCGDGVLESPEQCDDGLDNGTVGSCCTATCMPRAAGTDCDDDGNLCTNDACDGAGACTHTIAPAPICAEPTAAKGASLKVVSKAAPATDQVKLKWGKGPIVPNADFGAPGTTTAYQICVYQGDDTLVYHGQPMGVVCGVAPCWKALPTGWKFTSKTGAPDGVTSVKLKEGVAPLKAKIQVKAKGNLTLATMPVTAPVVAQLRTSDGQCWGAVFPTPVKNDGTQFSAKSP